MNRLLHILIVVALLSVSGCKGKYIYDQTPSERSATFISDLKDELVNAPHGWRVLYFPNTDSLIFSDYSHVYAEQDFFSGEMGYGGRYFHMRFNTDGTVQMLGDNTLQETTSPRTSKYQMKQGATAQLTFTTHNYIHQLVNSNYQGSSDFFFQRVDSNGDLLFSTFSYSQPARELIRFQKIPTEEAWHNDIKKAYQNRVYFQDWHNFQISIHQGSRIFFKSDRNYRDNKGNNLLLPYRNESLYKRYHLFLFTSRPEAYQGDTNVRFAILGSGYTGTHEGLTFEAGIRYDGKYTFRDFIREGNQFTCELVRVYDPLLRTWRHESKHRHPTGEPTGIVATIYPAK